MYILTISPLLCYTLLTEMISKKKDKKTTSHTLIHYLPIISSTLVVLLTITIFLLAKGYRIDFTKGEVKYTGAIVVKSQPSGATVTLNGENIGRTTKSKIVESGEYDVVVKKDKYREWKKKVSVVEEKPTQLFPWLIAEELKKYTIWDSKQIAEKVWINENRDVGLILLKDTDEDDIYSIWKYKIEKGLFDITSNPTKIWTTDNPKIEISLSPDGTLALLTIKKEGNKQEIYFVDTSSFNVEKENLTDFSYMKEPQLSWSKDSKYLIIETETEIFSYNHIDKTTRVLMKKTDGKTHVWTTSKKGVFYFLEETSQKEDKVYLYTLEAITLKELYKQTMLKEISMQKDLKYINYYRESLPTPVFFTNSPINTQTVGRIDSISVDENAGIVLISSETSSYLYNIKNGMYVMISPYPTKFGEIAYNNRSIIFYSNDIIGIFTFDKDELDHTEELGSKIFTKEKDVENIQWISNSRYLSYSKDGIIYISEIDGENEYEIIPLDNTYFHTVKYSLDSLTVFGNDNEGNFCVDEYRLTN